MTITLTAISTRESTWSAGRYRIDLLMVTLIDRTKIFILQCRGGIEPVDLLML